MPGEKRRRRANGEGTIYQRASDGLWVGMAYVYTTTGVLKRRPVYGHSFDEVREKLDRLRGNSASGVAVPDRTITVAGYLDHWLAQAKETKRATTHRGYESAVRLHIVPVLGSKSTRTRTWTPCARRSTPSTGRSDGHPLLHDCYRSALRAPFKVTDHACDLVDLLRAYLNRAGLLHDLREASRQLHESRDGAEAARSVRTVAAGFRKRRLADRLTDDQVQEIITGFEAGTPRWQLAERYKISVRRVGRLLCQHGRRRKDRRGGMV